MAIYQITSKTSVATSRGVAYPNGKFKGETVNKDVLEKLLKEKKITLVEDVKVVAKKAEAAKKAAAEAAAAKKAAAEAEAAKKTAEVK